MMWFDDNVTRFWRWKVVAGAGQGILALHTLLRALAASSAFLAVDALYAEANLPFDLTQTAVFQDKMALFSVVLPAGYSVQDQSGGTRSKSVVRWGANCQVVFLSSIMNKPWNPQAAMEEKIAALRQGAVVGGAPDISARLARLDIASGYEFELRKSKTHVSYGFAGVAQGRSFSCVVEAQGPANAAEVVAALTQCLRQSLKIKFDGAMPAVSTRQTPLVAAPVSGGNTDEWAAAEASIKAAGFVADGQRVLAMIGGKILGVGDTVKVPYGGREYLFRITAIDQQMRKVSVVPVK